MVRNFTMFLWCILFLLVGTLPSNSVSHRDITTSPQGFERLSSGFLSKKVLNYHPYALFQKSITNNKNYNNDDKIRSMEDKFVAKHLWDSKKYTNPHNFDYFRSNPGLLKKYLIELDQKMFNENILPTKEQMIHKKFKNTITIVDASITKINSDIKGEHKKIGRNKQGDLFVTNNKYEMTEYEISLKEKTLEIIAKNLKGPFVYGLDPTGKHIVHLERPSYKDSVYDKKTTQTPLAKFYEAELNDIDNNRSKFHKEVATRLKLSDKRKGLLNENNSVFKELQKKYKPKCIAGGRRRRSLRTMSGGCAIMIKPTGDVESIFPEQFLDSYKKADRYGKKVLADIAVANKNKIISNDLNQIEIKKVNSLLELEKTKSYVKDVNTIDDVLSFPISASSKSASENIIIGTYQRVKHENHKFKISRSKVAKVVAINIKSAKAVSHGISKANNYLSAFFTAKTILNGIMHNDTTSLAIVGGQLGFNALTSAFVIAGTKYSNHITSQFTKAILAEKDFRKISKLGKTFNTASKVGKAAKAISEASGIIGTVADIGLSTWSLTKSVDRFLNANDKFDRNTAIADIVGDAIDIAVTAVVTPLSFVPLIAPFAIAAGIVISLLSQLAFALFKAGNEVARINTEVPLLDFEKNDVFRSRFFDWFGTRKPDYIDNLVDEKKANDIAVQHSLEVLKNNIEILGIVVPSRTLYYEGSCTLTNQYCATKNAWGCTKWENEHTMQTGCDWERPCGTNREKCENSTKNHGAWGYNQKRCKCAGKTTTTFGEPRKNSFVDFTKKQQLYWERSVPKDVENAVFQCKPGSKSYIDHKVHQEHRREDFLCENAIGLLQPDNRRQPGQAMLFVLEDGNDKVYASQQGKPNLFLMGNDGTKTFIGGGGADDFIFDSNCTMSLRGVFDGSHGDDSITLGNTCAKGSRITVDFNMGKLTSVRNNLDLRFNGIENVNGRKNEGETFMVSCMTRRVSGNGGSTTSSDVIHILNNCKYDLTVFGSSYTNIASQATAGIIRIVFDQFWTGSQVRLDVYPQETLRLNLFFVTTTSSQLTNVVTTKTNTQLEVELATSTRNKIELMLTMKLGVDNFSIRFTENPVGSPDSVLFLSTKSQLTKLFFHNLPHLTGYSSPTRTGCKFTENVFEISGSTWNVFGGDLSDEFVLNTDIFGKINGNSGIDSIKIGQNCTKPIVLDLGADIISSVENVYGIPEVPLTVYTFCDTLLVATKGGSKITPDLITIPKMHCKSRHLRIIAEGYVHVLLEERKRHDEDTVQIIANGDKLKLELETKSTEIGNTVVVIPTSSKNWAVIYAKSHNHQIIVNLKDSGTEGLLMFKFDTTTTNEKYLQSPYIQIFDPNCTQIPGVLIFERTSGTPNVIYDLRQTQNESITEGFANLENIFLLDISKNSWNVSGGNLNDEFILLVEATEHVREHSIFGGGDDNTLILETAEKTRTSFAPFVVNLLKKEFGYLNPINGKMGMIDSIQNVIGRPGAQDIFYANCNTKSFNGQGGGPDVNQNDLINITDQDCNYNLLTVVPQHTTLINSAKRGQFTYYITNLSTSSFELNPTHQNEHMLKFLFHPWQIIKAVAFNESTRELGLKISNEIVHGFKLWASSRSSEYSNPVFEFSPDGSSVSSDIRVSTDGVTMATFWVAGLKDSENVYGLPVDVNRFLINITSRSDHSFGRIYGCSDGLRCSANQFWIFNLNTKLEVLDGGNCKENNCTNYIFFPTNPNERKLHFDLDMEKGRVTTDDGEIVISQLKNIHELHGSKGMSANVMCSTTQVSKLDVVLITQAGCQSDLVIGVEEYTRVIFEKIGNKDMNITSIEKGISAAFATIDEEDDYDRYEFEDDEMGENNIETDNNDDDKKKEFNSTLVENEMDPNLTFSSRTIHYWFARPMSFDPEGDLLEMLRVDHVYHLPFDLDSLENIGFNSTEKRFYYTIDRIEYSHKMISHVYFWEQFYSQPSFLTHDGYSIQVSRDGSLWATLGNTSNEVTQESLPYLMETATELEVTMIIQSLNNFYYIGHSGKKHGDRNVVQNMPDKTSHLAGGGANDTIYDILSLDNDVYIYTGYNEDSYMDWDASRKQTIDLTDIVVPIRNISGTKFVPLTTTNGNNLSISMQGYEKYFPGKVIIVNGVFPWVAKRIQLLLNGAIMDLVAQDTLNEETTTEDYNPRNRRSVEGLKERSWAIKPRPLIIPGDISIYSISTEDLENGQDIKLESTELGNGTFQVVRNGSDLYMTNAASLNRTEIKAIIINDFWNTNKLDNDGYDTGNNNTKIISGVTIRLPGLNLVLNETNVMNGDDTGNSSVDKVTITPWKQALYEFEEILLEDMPDIPRSFYCYECLPWWKQTTKLLIVLAGVLSIALMVLGGFIIFNQRQKKGNYAVAVVTNVNTDKDNDAATDMEMMKLKG